MPFEFSTEDITNIPTDQSTPQSIDVDLEGGTETHAQPAAQSVADAQPADNGEGGADADKDKNKGMIDIPDDVIAGEGNKDAPENTSAPEQSPTNDSTPSPYKLFGKKLFDEGVLTVFDETKVETLEDLFDAVNATIEGEVEAYKAGLPVAVRKIVEHAERTGETNLKVAIEAQQKVLDLQSITPDSLKKDEKMQEDILFEDLKSRGYTDARAKRYIDNVKANEALEEEALEALTAQQEAAVVRAKQIEESNAAAQKQLQETHANTIKTIRKEIDATAEIVPGVKLTKKEQDTVFASMTTAAGQDEQGNPINSVGITRSKNPIAFEKMLHFLHSKGVFNVDKDGNPVPDWSYFIKGAKTAAATKTAQAVEPGFRAGAPGVQQGDDDLMSALRKQFS